MLYKLFEIYFSIVIEIDLTNNLIKLFTIRPWIFLVLNQITDLFFINETIIISIEKFEGLFELFLTKIMIDFAGECDELTESNFARLV